MAFNRFTAGQFVPELFIFSAILVSGFDKHAVMVANHLFGAVASHRSKVFIHINDVAFEVKLNHAHHFVDGTDLAILIHLF